MAAALNLVSLGSKLRDVALDRIAKATVKTQDLKREAQNSFQNNDFLGAIGHDIDEKISPRSVFKKGLVEIKIFFFFVKDHILALELLISAVTQKFGNFREWRQLSAPGCFLFKRPKLCHVRTTNLPQLWRHFMEKVSFFILFDNTSLLLKIFQFYQFTIALQVKI